MLNEGFFGSHFASIQLQSFQKVARPKIFLCEKLQLGYKKNSILRWFQKNWKITHTTQQVTAKIKYRLINFFNSINGFELGERFRAQIKF